MNEKWNDISRNNLTWSLNWQFSYEALEYQLISHPNDQYLASMLDESQITRGRVQANWQLICQALSMDWLIVLKDMTKTPAFNDIQAALHKCQKVSQGVLWCPLKPRNFIFGWSSASISGLLLRLLKRSWEWSCSRSLGTLNDTYRIYSNKRRPRISAAPGTKKVNKRRPRITRKNTIKQF